MILYEYWFLVGDEPILGANITQWVS